MQTPDLRHQLNIYWRKIVASLFLLVFTSSSLFAQARFNAISTSGQDDKAISYGFFLAVHTNSWRVKYSEEFLNPENAVLGKVQSIVPLFTPGFSLGFLTTFRLHDQVNILFTPKVAFYEFKTDINFFGSQQQLNNSINGDTQASRRTIVTESTMVEFPLLFKYKAQRFNNSRMFFTAGGSAMFRTKDQEEADIEGLVTTGKDFTVDMGIGFDLYFKFFKFSPEVRFSHGLNNMYQPETSDLEFAGAIESLKRKSITLYLNFQ
jgi:hypothetical protein